MRKTKKARVFPILLALLMVLALLPATANAAEIQEGTPTITPNIGRSDGTMVGFAGQEWWVIGDAGGGVYQQPNSITLLVKDNRHYYGYVAFRAYISGSGYEGSYTTAANNYADSSLANYLNGSNVLGTFLAKEQSLINLRTLTTADQITGADAANQNLWALSCDEFDTIANNTVREYNGNWWLRSPAGLYAAYLGEQSSYITYDIAIDFYSARPAFSLNLSSVLFTSDAVGGGKPAATVGANLSATTAPSSTIKFTMEDSSVAPSFMASTTARSGDTLTITYSGAVPGADRSISAMVKRNGSMTYYGKLSVNPTASGTTTVTLPADFDPATDTLEVFEEELNGDFFTDFATTPITLDITAPTTSSLDTGVPQTGDSGSIAVLWLVLICATLGMLCLIIWRKRQRATIGNKTDRK